MKTTKKFLAIFLALTVLFAVCSLSVFATTDDPWTRTVDDDEIDHNKQDGITGEGRVRILSDGRTIQYAVESSYEQGEYTGPDPVCTLYAQCAIVYTDGSSEVVWISQEFMLRAEYNEEVFDEITASSNKEIVMVCCEFQIFNATGTLWEATLDVPYTS